MATVGGLAGVTFNVQPRASSSGRRGATNGRDRAKSVPGSLRSAAAATRDEMAMMTSISALPVGGRSLALAYATKLRLQSSSSSAPFGSSRLHCNAKLGQDDQEQSESPSTDAESDKTGITAAVSEEDNKQEFQRVKEDIQTKAGNFWHNLKEQHVIYKRDRDEWGLGFNPIFTVHEDAQGNRYQVDVNEKEIRVRSGVGPDASGFVDDECRALAEKRIELAKRHARDIELGLINPSPLSVMYSYERENANVEAPWKTLDPVVVAPAHFISMLIILLSVAFLGMGAKWLLSKKEKKREEDPVQDNKLRLMQMRKLKAQMSRESSEGETDNNRPLPHLNGENGVVNRAVMAGEEGKVEEPKEVFEEMVQAGKPRVDDEEFQRKVTEIRAMARKARIQEQESAEARSAQRFERKKLLEQERNRVQGLDNSADDLDALRRFGAESSDGLDFVSDAVKLSGEKRFPKVEENGGPSTSEAVGASSDSPRSKQPASLSPVKPSSLPVRATSNPPAQRSTGVKPRIILSADEARARIAAKRARSSSPASKPDSKPETGTSKLGDGLPSTESRKEKSPATETPSSTKSAELRGLENTRSQSVQETSTVLPDRALETAAESEYPLDDTSNNLPQAYDSISEEKTKKGVARPDELLSESEDVNPEKQIGERTRDGPTRDSGRERGPEKSKDEEEEMEWMRDDVLREIVFKVQANEEAGRDPFHNLNSEQETLFFKGLERKFEREGDEVKKWIKDRVENIDYGKDGISIYDPPESYELKWKEGVDRPSKSTFMDKFREDRERIINEKRGLSYSSPLDKDVTSTADPENSPLDREETVAADPEEKSLPLSSAVPSSRLSTSSPNPLMTKDSKTGQERSREVLSGDNKTKTVISSSPRTSMTSTIRSTSQTTKTSDSEAGKEKKENWDHTKRWAKDLERKYAMETDPATKALMREIGQDLDRWITEDEIEAASRMLDKGVEGEEEYVKMHYEKTKDKIKRQREMFGREAMMNKYSEYKSEAAEPELWWLSLPFVVCIGLRAMVEGEQQTGLYSVDVGAALEGVKGLPSVSYHTVAFQDRGDAQNFCTLVNTQPEKLSAEGAELVPFDPKALYNDAKSEGYKVTVIKKGQLQFSVDKPFEEVESRILEISGSRYIDELLNDRVIDVNAVVDEGLGFGRRPQ